MITAEHLKDMDLHFMVHQEMFQFVNCGWQEELVLTPEGEQYVESQILSEQDEESIKEFIQWLAQLK